MSVRCLPEAFTCARSPPQTIVSRGSLGGSWAVLLLSFDNLGGGGVAPYSKIKNFQMATAER